jgi:hypothetical protein
MFKDFLEQHRGVETRVAAWGGGSYRVTNWRGDTSQCIHSCTSKTLNCDFVSTLCLV